MYFLPISLALLGTLAPLVAQEPEPQWDVEIPGPIADGEQAEPALEPEPINFKVLTSSTRRVKVTEAAEMSDLPPVKGTINVTVQMVKDPGLPDPLPALPALSPDDQALTAPMDEQEEKDQGSDLLVISATVYDHSRTFLRISPNGKAEGEIAAWTNIDFNHFSGWSTYRVKDSDGRFHDRGLLMGIGNTDTRERQGNDQDDEPEIPVLPDLAAAGPSFVVTEGKANGEAMDTLSQIHDLYRKEGARMEAAFHAREKAEAERRAYLLANPPVPDDVEIRFWKRDQPSGK